MPRPEWDGLRQDLAALHAAALAAADPGAAVERALRVEQGALHAGGARVALAAGGRIRLVAFGKAAPRMARAALARLGGRVADGVVAHPHAAPAGGEWPAAVRAIGAGHPLPDEGSLAAGEAVAALLADGRSDDLVLVLVSGGGSALLEAPIEGVSLAELRDVTRGLQRAGADIVALNTVRRALSRIKGGGLARLARPARVVALLLSDVMGDRPEAIASGPTVPSPTGPAEALEVLRRHGLADRFPRVAARLASAAPPAAGGPAPLHTIVGSNRMAAEALAREAAARGFRAEILSTFLEGEAREVGRVVGGLARSVREQSVPFGPPACLVLGGETTVTVRGEGRGGRNQELALGAAHALAGLERAAVLAVATDGVDGSSDAAGAIATGDTLSRAAALGLSPDDALARSDSAAFFAALGDAWVTGPSGTNVNDLAIVLVYP